MSVKEMWAYILFQTKGYKVVGVVIALGSICSALAAYINSFLYAKIIDQLLIKQYDAALQMIFFMIGAIWLIQMISHACGQIFEQYVYPSRDETKKRTAQKAFLMEYEELEKEETLSAFRKTRAGENGTGSIDTQLRLMYEFFTESVKVVFAFIFLVVLILRSTLSGINGWITIFTTLLLIGLFLLSFWLSYRISSEIGRKQKTLNEENERTNSVGAYLGNVVSSELAAKTIRLYGMQDYFLQKCQNQLGCCRLFTKFGIFEGKQHAKSSFIIQVLAGYIYVYVAIAAFSGTISTGDVLMYAGAIITMMMSIQAILQKHNQINYANQYLNTYEEFIKKPNMHYEGTLPIEKRDDGEYALSFSHVSFKYPGTSDFVIKDLSIQFKIGEKLAVVGLNGAGKTTLIKLLLRLYEPTEGEILLNGINIGKYDYKEYLSIFSVVFQDFKLFDFPLDENIASCDEVDSQKVKEVIEKVGLTSLVEKLPQKEHTLLYHENGAGVALSGGEAQKVAIARALYKDAPFVILDEPTAALDPIAEAEIYERFDFLVGQKTAIYISHRMSSCQFCSRIIVLDKGKIVEEGTHEELIAEGGIYAKLYKTQADYYKCCFF